MPLNEFDIISKYFANTELAFGAKELVLGIGDDCAIFTPEPNEQLVVSMDMLVEGVHFLENSDPTLLGQRSLLVNLSDLAAMGARPLFFTLAVSLPEVDERWLEGFSKGLATVARANSCPLVGGDTTSSHPKRGGRTLCIQVHGAVPKGKALTRGGAQVGDSVYVSGTIGDSAAGLQLLQGPDTRGLSDQQQEFLHCAFYQPESRISLGIALRELASAAIDISDGLASDLGHIIASSRVGASVDTDRLPISEAFKAMVPEEARTEIALGGGDDYELCFTIAPRHEEALRKRCSQLGVTVTRIGQIDLEPGLRWKKQGEELKLDIKGYRHFEAARRLVNG
ncbi:MAG: thiamine-phosphate kinase [Pseudohongiellaceae bacterium]|nr:thiamine-phosphate kinase [Pseudohongiellaceae bacterium]